MFSFIKRLVPGDANAAGLVTTLWEPLPFKSDFQSGSEGSSQNARGISIKLARMRYLFKGFFCKGL